MSRESDERQNSGEGNRLQSMLVIGLGRFGFHLAKKLAELGNEVMCVDRDEAPVNRIAPLVTSAQIGDCTDEDVMAELGVDQYDVCFVCMSDDFQSSLEITSLLKEHGAHRVVSKADRDIHAKFLLKVGADYVVTPERDMAQRTAVRFSARNTFDYIELADDYAIFELETPEAWVGRTAIELNIRARYNVNIIGTKYQERMLPYTDASRAFERGAHLILAGSKKDILLLTNARK